jgi:hypothetical protein
MPISMTQRPEPFGAMRHNMPSRDLGPGARRRLASRIAHIRAMMQGRVDNMLQNGGPLTVARNCPACAEEFYMPWRWKGRAGYCPRCTAIAHYARMGATSWVTRAIRLGRLMRADQFRCADCPNWAAAWDHRDYTKPWQVESVCGSCNRTRPLAFRLKPYLASAEGAWATAN